MNDLIKKANELQINMHSDHITENFLWSEIVCPCCDTIKIVPGVFAHMARLQVLRSELGSPINVNSGHRCSKHNVEVGGAKNSWHLLFATDVRPEDRDANKLKIMYRVALTLDFGGIGLYEDMGFIHLDLRPETIRWRG